MFVFHEFEYLSGEMIFIFIKYQHSSLLNTAICNKTIKVFDLFFTQIIIRVFRIINISENIRIQAVLLSIDQMLFFDHNHHRGKRVSRIINTLYRDNVIFIIDIRLIKRFIPLFDNDSLTLFDFDSKLYLVYIINIYKIHLTFFACGFKTIKSI